MPLVTKFTEAHMDIAVELEIAFNKKLKPVDWFSKDAWFRAILDLAGCVDPGKKQTIRSILDWKTGQVRPSVDQLRLYNLTTFLKWPDTERVTSFFAFIDHKKYSDPVTSNRSELESLKDEFFDRAEGIQIADRNDDWPARKCYKCNWCGIQDCRYVRRK